MQVLVAGCGWLGREVARRLVARGDRVTAVVRTLQSAARLRTAGIDALDLDLAEPGAARAITGAFDAVLAMQSAAGPGAEAYRRAYLDATLSLLESSAASRARFVYVSSTGVFGRSDGSWVYETTAPEPGDATAGVLVTAERQVLDAARENAPAIVVRCSGLYGPERTGTIERVRSGALRLGPGDQAWMNFCHRDDAAGVILAALDRGRAGAVYHASDAQPAQRREVVSWIATRLGLTPRRDEPGSAERGGRGANRRVSGAATRRELSVELAYPSFREGFAPFLPAG